MSAVWPAVNSYVETYRSGSDIFRYIARLSDFAYYTFSLIYIYVICKILIRRFCSEQTRLANRKKSALARIASSETHPSLTFLTFQNDKELNNQSVILSLILSLLNVPPYALTSVINRDFAVLLAI